MEEEGQNSFISWGESDKTQVLCQVGTGYMEQKKKKKSSCRGGNLLMGVVNSTRQKQWNFEWHFQGAEVCWQMLTKAAICQKPSGYKMKIGRRAVDQLLMGTKTVILNSNGFRRGFKSQEEQPSTSALSVIVQKLSVRCSFVLPFCRSVAKRKDVKCRWKKKSAAQSSRVVSLVGICVG